MLANPSVPASRWEEITNFLVFGYSGLSLSGRNALIQRFTEVAQHSELEAAMAGFHGLQSISDFDNSMAAQITPEAKVGLSRAYRELVNAGRISRSPSFETRFGIKY